MKVTKSYQERVDDYIKQQVALAREKGITGTVIVDHSHIISDELKTETLKLFNS